MSLRKIKIILFFITRYRLSPAKAHHLSTILEADSQLQIHDSRTSISTSDSIPNVMDELFQRNILTSPFHWSGQDTLSYISTARCDSVKKTFKRNSEDLGTNYFNTFHYYFIY